MDVVVRGTFIFLFVGIIMELNESSVPIDMLYERITTIRQLVKYFSDIHTHIHFIVNIGGNVTNVEVYMNELQYVMSYS